MATTLLLDDNMDGRGAEKRGGGNSSKKLFPASSYLRKLIITQPHPNNNNKHKGKKQIILLGQSAAGGQLAASTSDLEPPDYGTSSSAPPSRIVSTSSNSSSAGSDSQYSSPGLEQQMRSHRLIDDMFSALTSLKEAYSRLQSAHLLSDPDKLHAADKAVVAQLKNMSDLKHAYTADMDKLHAASAAAAASAIHNDNNPLRHSSSAAATATRPAPPQTTNDVMILKSYEGLISNFHSELEEKNALVDNLKDMLAKSTLQKEKLERKMKKLQQQQQRRLSTADVDIPPPNDGEPSKSSPSPQMLEAFVLEASEAATSFTELLVSFMKMAEWDVEAAARSIEPDIIFARRSHVKYAFEAYLTRRMLSGFESENFSVDSSLPSAVDVETRKAKFWREFQGMRNADPVQLLSLADNNNNSNRDDDDDDAALFAKYCLKKFVEVIHPKMEESFFGSLEAHREQISQGKHPTTQFYHCFLQLAKSMWLLHSLAFSFSPAPARIFQAQRDAEFSPPHMDTVIPAASTTKPRVGFTVMPGFIVQASAATIIKCRIYPLVTPPSPAADKAAA